MVANYDEFGLLSENAAEAGLKWSGPPLVERVETTLSDGQRVSALQWGEPPPQLVLLHGGAQNAHTWDTMSLALNRRLLAIDLPGHGHSGWREDRDYWPLANAETVAQVMAIRAPSTSALAGMSLGGLTAIRLAAARPDLVPKLIIVDVTPGVDEHKSAPIADFVQGPEVFASFEEILERTIRFNPTRSQQSLRRGVLHNARPQPDGSWVWRYDRLRPPGGALRFEYLWEDVERLSMPVMLVVGALSAVVVDDDIAEFRARQPQVRIEVVEGAGHSVQGDQPVVLAGLIEDFAPST